jgi:hypothetical protein
MVGPTNDDKHMPPQSPRTKGIFQALVREVKKHMEGIDADVHVTNEKIGMLEATQLATDIKLGTMEASVADIDNNLVALLRCFDDLMRREHDRQQGHNNNNNNNNNNKNNNDNNNNHIDEHTEDN